MPSFLGVYMISIVIFIGIIFLLSWILKIRRVIVFEYEKGIRYSSGKLMGIVEPGAYWYLGFFTTLKKTDIRPRFLSVTGQEIISSDGVSLKFSIAVKFEISDLNIAIHKIASYENVYASNKIMSASEEALYLIVQLSLREVISSHKIESILENRNEISNQITEKANERVSELGLKIIFAEIKDIMFPGELKKIFAQVSKARQEGLAMLEKARGETAALRSLANSAKILNNNPALMQLRILHSTGNTLVTGMSSFLKDTMKDEN